MNIAESEIRENRETAIMIRQHVALDRPQGLVTGRSRESTKAKLHQCSRQTIQLSFE